MPGPSHRFCVAPMMDWTDRHDRRFLRLFSKHALLYTEMVTAAAIKHGDRHRLLDFNTEEHPVALQLGGSDPELLASAAAAGEQWGYDEINLNCGCPSDRVQSGAFGACLMVRPRLVADCVSAMRNAVNIPVTVKTRIGIDDQDSEEFLLDFVEHLAAAGCNLVIIHARKAILSGLSPKENREIPPLVYERAYRVKERFPEMEVILNGGLTDLESAAVHLQQLDGLMFGREAYQNPYLLAGVDGLLFADGSPPKTRLEYLLEYLPYVKDQLALGTPLQHMTRHILGLFKGQRGGKQFRRHLSEHGHKRDASIQVLEDAIAYVS